MRDAVDDKREHVIDQRVTLKDNFTKPRHLLKRLFERFAKSAVERVPAQRKSVVFDTGNGWKWRDVFLLAAKLKLHSRVSLVAFDKNRIHTFTIHFEKSVLTSHIFKVLLEVCFVFLFLCFSV